MRESSFAFLRGTFYRWFYHFAAVPDDVRSAPSLLIVGDIHIENFGTWRDAEGRLAWGVNDFDEAEVLPYTNDLVRLCTSVVLATDASPARVCVRVLKGYEHSLRAGGTPFILGGADHE